MKKISKKILKSQNIFIFLIAVFIILLIFTSFSIYKKYYLNNDENTTITQEVMVTTNKQEGKLPDGFPDDFPPYPGATVLDSTNVISGSQGGMAVSWVSEDEIPVVSEYYQQKLESAGWVIVFVSETPQSLSLNFSKDGLSGFLGAAVGDSGTIITVAINKGN